MENGTLMHVFDPDALRADPNGLGWIAADSLRINTNAGLADANVLAVRVHSVGSEPGFATRDEAEAALIEVPRNCRVLDGTDLAVCAASASGSFVPQLRHLRWAR